MNESDKKRDYTNYKIISSQSKSWYIGKPGTTKDSYSITWSPGALLLYGAKGSLTLIYKDFNTYHSAKRWMAECSLEQFKGAISHNHPEDDDIEYFHEAFKVWGLGTHFK